MKRTTPKYVSGQASAVSKSPLMSSMSSMSSAPTDILISSGETPAARRSSSVLCRLTKKAGWVMSVSTPPRLMAKDAHLRAPYGPICGFVAPFELE